MAMRLRRCAEDAQHGAFACGVLLLFCIIQQSHSSIIGWENLSSSNSTFMPTELVTFSLVVNQSDLSVWNGLSLPISVLLDGVPLDGIMNAAPDPGNGVYTQAVWNDTLLIDQSANITIHVLNSSDPSQILFTSSVTAPATRGYWTDCYVEWDPSGAVVLDVKPLVPQVTCLWAPNDGSTLIEANANIDSTSYPQVSCTVPVFPIGSLPVNSMFTMSVNLTQGHSASVAIKPLNASDDLAFSTGSVWTSMDLSELCDKSITLKGQFDTSAQYYCHYKSGDDDVQSVTVSPTSSTELECSLAKIANWKRLIFDSVFEVGRNGAGDTVLYTELLSINFGYPNCNSWLFVLFGLIGLVAVVALVGVTVWIQRNRLYRDATSANESSPLVKS